jgi:hypothetical protein
VPRKRTDEQPSLHKNDLGLSCFAPTPNEIKHTVERGVIHKSELFIKAVATLRIKELLETIRTAPYNPKEICAKRAEFNIDKAALLCLDHATPPIPYPFYFSTPLFLIEHPELILYYRNLAMVSRRAMQDLGLPTDIYEDSHIPPSDETALELARHFNGITSKLVTMTRVTADLHLEIVLLNIRTTTE